MKKEKKDVLINETENDVNAEPAAEIAESTENEKTKKAPKSKGKKIFAAVAISLVVLIAAAAALWLWGSEYIYVDGERISKTVTELNLNGKNIDNLPALKNYTQLKKLQAQGVDFTDEELELIFDSLPKCDIECTLNLFGEKISNKTAELDLKESKIPLEKLEDGMAKYLKYMSGLEKIVLPWYDVENERVYKLVETIDAEVVWTVNIGGMGFSSDTEVLDFPSYRPTTVEELQDNLQYFSNLEKVDVAKIGALLDSEELWNMEQSTGIDFIWRFSFGNTICRTDDTSVSVSGYGGYLDLSELKYFEKLESLCIGSVSDWEYDLVSDEHYLPNSLINLLNTEVLLECTELKEISLANCTGVRHLDVSSLEKLEKLSLNYVDTESIKGSSGLKELSLECTNLTDLSKLENMEQLEVLDMYHEKINNLSPLSKYKHLRKLWFWDVNIGDWSALSQLTDLEFLLIEEGSTSIKPELSNIDESAYYAFTDTSLLKGMTKLEDLTLSGCGGINNLDFISGMKNLKELDLNETSVSNFAPISNLKNIQSLDLFACYGLNNLNFLKGMKNLEELRLSGTSVSNLSPISGLENLQSFSIGLSKVKNLTPLYGLPNLNYIQLYKGEFTSDQIDQLKKNLPDSVEIEVW